MTTVKIYTTTYCGYCARAKDFFRQRAIAFEEVDVTGNDEMREKLVEMSNGMRTVPQIFINGTHVGGYTDLIAADADGSLARLLSGASAAQLA